MSATTDSDKVLDHGIESSRLVVVASGDPDNETKFHIPAETLAKAGGVHSKDPCMYASTLTHAEIESVEAPFHTGLVFKSGDEPVGDVQHPTFTHVSEHETGGYHVVASKGHNDFKHDPVKIDLSHKDVNGDPQKFVKRATRWEENVGQSSSELVAGLQTHEGTDKKGNTVSRVLVPVEGDHACTKAMMLNQHASEGPFAQYNTRNRKVVNVDGKDHIVVDKDHLMKIADTLQENLQPATKIGKHGLTLHIKPLPAQKANAQAGKVVVKMKINRIPTSKILSDSYKPDEDASPRVSYHHAKIALGGGDGSNITEAVETQKKKNEELSKKILNISLGSAPSSSFKSSSDVKISTLSSDQPDSITDATSLPMEEANE